MGVVRPAQGPSLFHFDGEFADVEDLVVDTLTGRNFGWLPQERHVAMAHVARVIRLDQGFNPRTVTLPDGRGIPYATVMRGGPELPPPLRIQPAYRIDISTASDDEIARCVARYLRVYMESLVFGTSTTHRHTPSAYDTFLAKNDLPLKPDPGETTQGYASRLRSLLVRRRKFRWVRDGVDGTLALHAHAFKFGPLELRGLRVFLATGGSRNAGNCVSCHPPPRFTDEALHTTGVSQVEYDGIHGEGTFKAMQIPDLVTRNATPDRYLPQSSLRPYGSARFRSAPTAGRPGEADLGAWNILGNPDFPKPQARLAQLVCSPSVPGPACSPDAALTRSIARFKTPSLRDLGQGAPYFHSGSAGSIEEVAEFYAKVSGLARRGRLRNAAPELEQVFLDDEEDRRFSPRPAARRRRPRRAPGARRGSGPACPTAPGPRAAR